MHDLRWIREAPDDFDAAMTRRGLASSSAQILDLDGRRRRAQTALQEMQARRNEASKAIGQKKRTGEPADELMAEVAELKEKMTAAEEEERSLGEELEALLAGLPNVLAPEVPDGPDESANETLRTWGEKRHYDFTPKEHFDLGEGLGGLDFEAAAKLSGSRFVVVKGQVARLHRALAQFMLDLHSQEHGYLEVQPPLLVRDQVLFGTGQLPKFGEDQFRTEEGFWLIPTAEVPLTNLVAEAILNESELPLRFTAHTPCFRSEAGAAGRDTRGMLRQHQFEKVELVSVTAPEHSEEEHQRMVACAEEVLKRLGLHYRVVVLASGDTGFTAHKTYDLEVWLPGQGAYREISSCSNTGAFQARRMRARFRQDGEKGTRFLHSLNGSGVAVGRALIAVLETYQQSDGSVEVPEVLRPYLGGQERIAPS
ncbi:serine--tRNA ligase [Algihabitans sp.]|uniref:serine--tRNA ligase n=1 Tax=Algihabitans sp. TaxID=2821514 RepID=UPI003BAA9FB8